MPFRSSIFRDSGGSRGKGCAKFDVEYRGPSISDKQRQAVERLIADEEQLYAQARTAVFQYYTEHIYPLLSTSIGAMDELWPACRTIEEVMRLVKLGGLIVHEPRADGAVPIGLRFECSWDEEHAMGLRVVGSTIEAVGTDHVALDPRLDEWPGPQQVPSGTEP